MTMAENIRFSRTFRAFEILKNEWLWLLRSVCYKYWYWLSFPSSAFDFLKSFISGKSLNVEAVGTTINRKEKAKQIVNPCCDISRRKTSGGGVCDRKRTLSLDTSDLQSFPKNCGLIYQSSDHSVHRLEIWFMGRKSRSATWEPLRLPLPRHRLLITTQLDSITYHDNLPFPFYRWWIDSRRAQTCRSPS